VRRDRGGVRLEVLHNPGELEVSLLGAPATRARRAAGALMREVPQRRR
jgi:hypothetical protein